MSAASLHSTRAGRLVVAGLASFLVVLCVLHVAGLVYGFAGGLDGWDFHQWLALAGVGLRHGWSHMYDPQAQAAILGADVLHGGADLKTPPFIWAVAPLTLLPWPASYLVWLVLLVAATAAAVLLALPGRRARFLGLLAVFAAGPTATALFYGQPNPLTMLSAVATWWLIRRDQHIWAGVVLGLGFLAKPNIVVLVPVALVMAGFWRVGAGWTIATGIAAILSIVVVGPHVVTDYLHVLELQDRASVGPTPPTQITLTHLLPAGPALAVRALVLLAAAAISFRARGRADIALAAGAAASCLGAVYLHADDLLILAAPALVIARAPRPAWLGLFAVTWVVSSVPPTVMAAPLALTLAAWLVLLWLSPPSGAEARTPAPSGGEASF